uniref:Uncharacterized protein n=1 Tax=Nicotiana tabacum TaxID=4097 RepID=A0A1S4AUZ2_TOBAC|nr:PREDICTED: uncharacterized protein LOC107801505 [Nicotiana tabacum]
MPFELLINQSLEIGMCRPGQWMKLTKGSWVRSMSPFDHKFLDIRMASSAKQTLQVSLDEGLFSLDQSEINFFLICFYRVIFLVLGILLITLASFLSKSLGFYYGSRVTHFPCDTDGSFPETKLLPTGRKNSLAIFLYSSIVGVGSFFLRYVPQLLRSILNEIGIGEDMHNPLANSAAFPPNSWSLVGKGSLGACKVVSVCGPSLGPTWLGFWVVHKLVLAEDGSIDIGVSQYVGWSIRVFASGLIIQSSLDLLLVLEALICGVLISLVLRRIFRPKYVLRFCKNLLQIDTSYLWESQDSYTSVIKGSYGSRTSERNRNDTISREKCKVELLLHVFFLKKFSKEEWNKLTRDTTMKAMDELVSSTDFS